MQKLRACYEGSLSNFTTQKLSDSNALQWRKLLFLANFQYTTTQKPNTRNAEFSGSF